MLFGEMIRKPLGEGCAAYVETQHVAPVRPAHSGGRRQSWEDVLMPKAAPYTASNGFAVSIDQHTLLAPPDACAGWSPRSWRWSSGKRAMRRLESVTFCNLLSVR